MHQGLNLLRGISAFGIVGCHLMLSPVQVWGGAVTHFCDFNVALFAVMSGYLMLDKRCQNGGKESLKDWLIYVCKRAGRILPIYVIWSVLFLLFTVIFDILCDGGINLRFFDFRYWMEVFFCGSSSAHLWFLICLFYGQAILKIADIFLVFMSSRGRELIIFLCGLSMVVMSANFDGWFWRYPIRLFGFLFTGYALALSKIRIHPRILALNIVFLAGYHFWGKDMLPNYIRDWFLVIPVLLFFVKMEVSTKALNFAILCGETSMGVYLVHPLFTKIGGLLVRSVCDTPYGIVPVFIDWVLCWSFAVIATMIGLRFTIISRFIK